MGEKRFIIVKSIENLYALVDKEREDKEQIILLSLHKEQLDVVCDLLNEQQEFIEELQVSDEMGWKRAERFEKKCPKELHNKKMYIKRLEYKVQKFKEENGEQQATISQLQDLCGESDSENAKLRIENKKLQEEIKLLKPTNIEQYEQIVQLQEENMKLKKSEKINVEYAEQIVEENHKLRIAKNDLRIENEQLKNRLNKEYIKERSIK